MNALDLTGRSLARAYAKTSGQYTRTVLNGPGVTPQTVGALADLDGIDGWIDFLIDSAIHFDDKGMSGEYLRLTPDVFKTLAKLQADSAAPFFLNRRTGTINLSKIDGELEDLKFCVVPGTAGVEIGHSSAIRTLESAGAPARLSDQEDILTLTKAVGVYGFGAIAVQDEKAIVRPAGAPFGVTPEPDPEPDPDA